MTDAERRARERRNLRWLLARPATHRIMARGVTTTFCGRTYLPQHNALRATDDPSKVTCGNCRRSRLNIPAPKNVTPR